MLFPTPNRNYLLTPYSRCVPTVLLGDRFLTHAGHPSFLELLRFGRLGSHDEEKDRRPHETWSRSLTG